MSRTRRARAARRRKRRLDAVVNDLTEQEWLGLQQAWGGCAYCGSAGVPLQRDCVLPVSRGGRYTLGNVVPACRSCNTSKWNAEVTGWLRRKRLDESAFLLRQRELCDQVAGRPATGAASPGGPEAGPQPAREPVVAPGAAG